jgi:hypothetical protein
MGYRSELAMSMSKKGFEFLINNCSIDIKDFIINCSESIDVIEDSCPLIRICWSYIKLYNDEQETIFDLLSSNGYYCEYLCIGEELDDYAHEYNSPKENNINKNEYNIEFINKIDWQFHMIRMIEINNNQDCAEFNFKKEFPREFEQFKLEEL